MPGAPVLLGQGPTYYLYPWQTISLLKIITQSGKVKGLDIAKLSPALDENDKTSRLAARLLAELL